MRNKINEEITEISGINTEPFNRYSGRINLNEFLKTLLKEKEKAILKGYSDLNLVIHEDSGIVDIALYGNRDLTNKEKENDEIIEVIFRMKDKTQKGLTRDELFKQ